MVDGSLESPCRVLVKHDWNSFSSSYGEALQGKRCQDSLRSGGGRSVRAKISGGRGVPGEYFFCFCKTRHILLSDSANCTVLRAVVLTQYRRVTDGQTDGIAVASTALAKLRAVIKRYVFEVEIDADVSGVSCGILTNGQRHSSRRFMASEVTLR